MPIYCEQTSQAIVTQFDMGDVEDIGLVKFDFLGLRTLTIIDRALNDINRIRKNNNEELIDIGDEEICWDCESDVDECSFCGDFMFFGEGTNINNNAIMYKFTFFFIKFDK